MYMVYLLDHLLLNIWGVLALQLWLCQWDISRFFIKGVYNLGKGSTEYGTCCCKTDTFWVLELIIKICVNSTHSTLQIHACTKIQNQIYRDSDYIGDKRCNRHWYLNNIIILSVKSWFWSWYFSEGASPLNCFMKSVCICIFM